MPKLVLFLFLFTAFSVYSVIVYTEGTKGPVPGMNGKAAQGKMLFQKHNCTACHQIYGLGGFLGPELTTVMSDPEKGEFFARAILKTGTRRMPDFRLNEEETDNLVEFLKYVDQTAVTYRTKK